MKSEILKYLKVPVLGIMLIPVVSSVVSCKAKTSYAYTFEHAFKVAPVQNSYNIGDTIYFEINLPGDIEVLVNNEKTNTFFYKTFHSPFFDFPDGQIDCYEINQVGNEYTKLPALNAFTRVPYFGSLVNNDNAALVYRLEKSNGGQRFKVGFVCNQSGTFYFNPQTYYRDSKRGNAPADLNLSPEVDYDYLSMVNYPVNPNPDGSFTNNAHLYPVNTPNIVPMEYQKQSFLVIVN